ncbi:MAG: rRNA-processing protein las1 [Claussenomyces sp. TS43310]|nr:MAG: rRNA-processing protein las1 [Claussenomyces sp. TS43310]
MVQYVITPWRDRHELLDVRNVFYPSSIPKEIDAAQEKSRAVALVSVWVQRGNCPHLVESTALLVSAGLNDAVGISAYAVRAAYSTAFCRFVTGLLDGYQDKRYKLSMYSIAKNIGLPATFVELRHQCTHEELPSLRRLRAAAEGSLQWIWQHYWKGLEAPSIKVEREQCRVVLQEYLEWRAGAPSGNENRGQASATRVSKFDSRMILDVLMEFDDSMDARCLLQSTRLAAAIMNGKEDYDAFLSFEGGSRKEKAPASFEEIRAEMTKTAESLNDDHKPTLEAPMERSEDMMGSDEELGNGWTMWKGPWVPKPIGIV